MTHLEVDVEEIGEIGVFHLRGFLDAHNHTIFRSRLEELVSRGFTKIVVDFRELAYIGSSGIEVVLAHVQKLRDKGGDIVLASLSPKVFKVFDLLGLPSFFKIVGSVEEAKASFS